MTETTTNVPDWCRYGADAVITASASPDDIADLDAKAHARQRWQAVAIFEVTDKAIHVVAKPPYPGRYLFRPEGPDARPRLVHPRRFGLRPRPSKPPLYLAPADAPDVVLQRQRRDQLKRFRAPQ